jgi:hypothetical protein
LGILSSDFTSPFVIEELGSAARSDKPTIALMENKVTAPKGLAKDLNRMSLDLTSDRAGKDLAEVLEKFRPTLE